MNQTNLKRHSRSLFYILLALLVGLCFVRYSLQVNFPRELLLAVAVLTALLGDRDEIIALCMCCIPLHTSFQYAYALVFCILIYLVKFSQGIRFNLTIVPVLLMILWELLHCFGEPFGIMSFVSDCVPLLLLAVIMCSGTKGFDYDFIARVFALCIAGMCVVLLGKLLFLAGFDFQAAFSGLRRLGTDSEETKSSLSVTGGVLNPNTLGILCVLGATGLLQLWSAGRGRKTDILLVIFLLVFGTLTSSRTYLVCLALMALLLLFGQKGSLSRKFKFLVGIVVLILLAILMLYLFFPDLLEYYYSRFQVEDITTGRMDLMGIYHKFIISDPEVMFFGIGLHEFDAKVLYEYRVTALVPHNGLQETVVAWGLPGLLLFVILWLTMILRSRRFSRRQVLLNYIPLLILLAKIQAGQMLNSPYTMLAFSFAYLSLCADLRPGGNPAAMDGRNAS